MIGLFVLAVWCSGGVFGRPVEFDMESPNGNVTGTLRIDDDGVVSYSVKLGTEIVIPFSRLGFELTTASYPENSLYDHWTMSGLLPFYLNPRLEWSPIVGEQKVIEDHYNQLIIRATQSIPSSSAAIRRQVELNLRAYDIGVAVNMVFPSLEEDLVIADDVTEIKVLGDHQAWWAPADYDAQDYNFVESKLSQIEDLIDAAIENDATIAAGTPIGGATIQTPVTLKTSDGIYINIHEAGGDVFPSMNLQYDAQTLTFKAHLTPAHRAEADSEASASKPAAAIIPATTIRSPFTTPWRAVMVTRDPAAMLSNYMIYNLNEEPEVEAAAASNPTYDWVEGMKSIGVWWEMVKGDKTWRYTDDTVDVEIGSTDYSQLASNGRHGATTERVHSLIDFASKYQFDAVAFEGWNEGWEQATRDDKDVLFSHFAAYPDLNETAVVARAAAAGADSVTSRRPIALIKHHPVGAAIDDFAAHSAAALLRASELGYRSVKVTYDGGLLRDGTHRSSQVTNEHYHKVIKEAADHNLSVSIHGGLKPTGLSRRYPNLSSSTVQRTNAHYFLGVSASHTTILPWNHLIGSPIEYGSGILEVEALGAAESSDTLMKRIALLLVLYSPNQLIADTPENLEAHSELLGLISNIPNTWNRSIYIEAEIGKYVTVARNSPDGDDWYIAGISAIESRQIQIPLNFLDDQIVYTAQIYHDDREADAGYKATTDTFIAKDNLYLTVGSNGGFVVHLVKSGGEGGSSGENESAQAD